MHSCADDKIILNFLGDISFGEMLQDLHCGVKSKILCESMNPFAFCINELEKADLNVGNLECVLSDFSELSKPYSEVLRCPSRLTELLATNRIHVVNLSNNHSYDHGEKAFNETVRHLEANHICHFGMHRYALQETPLIIDIKGCKIGFLGFYLEETIIESNLSVLLENIRARIGHSKKLVDVLVLSLHWGSEFTSFPSTQQCEIAKMFFNDGVDIIYGHHPHRLHGAIQLGNKVLASSMGNFIFESHQKKNRITAILRIEINGKKVKNFKMLPHFINKKFQPIYASKYASYVNEINDKLYNVFHCAEDVEKNVFDKQYLHESRKGHLKNRIIIRAIVLLRIHVFLPFLLTLFRKRK